MATVDYFSLLVTACHRPFTYHCLVPVLAGKNEHRLVLFAGKREHHLDLVNMCFTPTNFYVHRSQLKVHPGARTCGFHLRHVRMHTHTDTTNYRYRYSSIVPPMPHTDILAESYVSKLEHLTMTQLWFYTIWRSLKVYSNI